MAVATQVLVVNMLFPIIILELTVFSKAVNFIVTVYFNLGLKCFIQVMQIMQKQYFFLTVFGLMLLISQSFPLML